MGFPERIERELRPGVKLLYSQTRDFKSALFRVVFAVPLEKETASGYSLLTNMLSLTTAEYPDIRSFAVAKDELYALWLDSYVKRSQETLLVTLEFESLADSFALEGEKLLEKAVKMLGGAIFAPNAPGGVFPKKLLDGEKRSLTGEIESIIENDSDFAFMRSLEIMCAGEPYATDAAGDKKLVKKLDGKTLYDVYYKYCLENAPVLISYVGEADIGEVAEYVEKYLPFAPRTGKIPECTVHRAGGFRRVREKTRSDECTVVIGASYAPCKTLRERVALALFDEIFGGASGRLFINVREKEGLCYFCSTVSPGVKNVYFIICGTEPANALRAEEAIRREFDLAANGLCSGGELDTAKKTLLRRVDNTGASPASISSNLIAQALAAPEERAGPEELRAIIRSVTAQEIAAITKTMQTELVYTLEDPIEGKKR